MSKIHHELWFLWTLLLVGCLIDEGYCKKKELSRSEKWLIDLDDTIIFGNTVSRQ